MKQHITTIAEASAGNDGLLKHVYKLQARYALNITPDEMAAQVSEESGALVGARDFPGMDPPPLP